PRPFVHPFGHKKNRFHFGNFVHFVQPALSLESLRHPFSGGLQDIPPLRPSHRSVGNVGDGLPDGNEIFQVAAGGGAAGSDRLARLFRRHTRRRRSAEDGHHFFQGEGIDPLGDLPDPRPSGSGVRRSRIPQPVDFLLGHGSGGFQPF